MNEKAKHNHDRHTRGEVFKNADAHEQRLVYYRPSPRLLSFRSFALQGYRRRQCQRRRRWRRDNENASKPSLN